MQTLDRWNRLSARIPKTIWVVAAAVFMFPAVAAATNVTVDCTGGTPGAFTSLQAAIDSLDLIGPHTITMVAGPCVENVTLENRQRITIQPLTSGAGVFIQSPDANVAAMRVLGSTQIVIIETGFSGGLNGVRITRGSEVQLLGCTILGNGNGANVDRNSTLEISGLIENNRRNGIVADASTLTVDPGTVIQNNLNGVRLVNRSSALFFAPVTISNNTFIGVNASTNSDARFFGDVSDSVPVPNVVEGNGFIGINVVAGSSVVLFDAQRVRFNGSSGEPLHAGVRVDDNATFATAGSGDIAISNNTGPGIEATVGGALDLTGTLITGNSEDGVRLLGNSQVGIFPPNTNTISGNGGQSIACDGTSVFMGDRTGLTSISCLVSNLPFRGGRSRALMMLGPNESSSRNR